MARPHHTETRRSWRELACAVLAVGLWLAVIDGCLNPRPDDYPSGANLSEEGRPVPQQPAGADDCNANPLALDCEEPVPPVIQPADEGDGAEIDAGAGDAGAADASSNADQ